jgi:hypothetical protein
MLLLALVLARPADAGPTPLDWWQSGGPRVRPNDTRIATMLLEGLRRSPSLVKLVDRVEASNVIVYLEMQPGLENRLAGCLTWITAAGNYRYVRASINPELSPDALIASIGHELQHVVEIIEHPSVTDPSSLLALYRRIGSGGGTHRSPTLDSADARAAGAQVRKDLRAMRVASAIPGGNRVSPTGWHEWYRQQRLPEPEPR